MEYLAVLYNGKRRRQRAKQRAARKARKLAKVRRIHGEKGGTE